MKLNRRIIQFKDSGGERTYFIVYTNLPETFGLSLEGAVENWLARLKSKKEFNVENLCRYINNKQIGYKCLTVDQYKKVKK